MYGTTRHSFFKKNIKFPIIIAIVTSIFLLVTLQNCFFQKNSGIKGDFDFFVKNNIGTIDDFNVNFTLENVDGNTTTYNIKDDKIQKLDYINYKIGLGFGDDYSFRKYLEISGVSEKDFNQKYGYPRAYYKYKNKSIYLISKYTSEQNSWNVLIEENDNYKILKVADISDEASKTNSLNFALKIENFNEDIYIYLESGIYILDSKNIITEMKFDVNKILKEVSDTGLIPSLTRVQYFEDKLYILSTTKEFEFYLVEYDIIKSSFNKYSLNYIPQCIGKIGNAVVVLSTESNKVFVEKLDNKNIVCSEITEISNLNLDTFMTQTSANKLITKGNRLYFAFSNGKNRDKGYIFNIDYDTLKLKGYKEIDLKDTGYYLSNTVIYFE